MAEFSFPFSPQPGSMLLQLPFAIREKIIRLAVVEYLEKPPEITYEWNDERSLGRVEIEHPILKTCKQLRRESAKIFFLENHFELECDLFVGDPSDANEMAAATLARAFGPYVLIVRSLVVSFTINNAPELELDLDVEIMIRKNGSGVSVFDRDVYAAVCDSDAAVCRCRIFQFAADHAGENILKFAQEYVRWLHAVVHEPLVVDCPSCGLKRMAVSGVCTRVFESDRPGDRAARPLPCF
jgi:hypothetical protein